jgi:hypothetical protein
MNDYVSTETYDPQLQSDQLALEFMRGEMDNARPEHVQAVWNSMWYYTSRRVGGKYARTEYRIKAENTPGGPGFPEMGSERLASWIVETHNAQLLRLRASQEDEVDLEGPPSDGGDPKAYREDLAPIGFFDTIEHIIEKHGPDSDQPLWSTDELASAGAAFDRVLIKRHENLHKEKA